MTTCARLWEVDALRDGRLSDGDADAHLRHRAGCAECRARHSENERFVELARALAPAADELHARRLRARILSTAAAPAPPPRRGAVVAASTVAVSAVALVAFLVARPHAPPLPLVTAEPLPSARMPAAARAARDVIALSPAARVDAGPVARVGPARVAAVHERVDPAAGAYAGAVDAYREKRWTDAATALAAFVDTHPGAPEAEDAMFLEASALAHRGAGDEAAAVAKHSLARYPASIHALELSILIARAARDRGDCDEARAAVASWQSSYPTETASALGACASK